MGTLKIRTEGLPEDIRAISTFFRKISKHITAFEVVEESRDYQNSNSMKVRRYLEANIDNSALEVND